RPDCLHALPRAPALTAVQVAGDLDAEREPVLEVKALARPRGAGPGHRLARAREVARGEAGVTDVETGDDAGEAVAEVVGLTQPGARARSEVGEFTEHGQGVHGHGAGDAALPGDADAALGEHRHAGLDLDQGAAPATGVEVRD